MTGPDKNEQADSLTTYQSMARSAVRGWTVYITFYSVAFTLVALTTRNNFDNLSGLLMNLAKDPAIWGIILMPPLFMMFLRWSAMDLATRLHNLDSEPAPLEQSLFEEADSFSEPTFVGEDFKLHSLLKRMIKNRSEDIKAKDLAVSIEIRDDVPNRLIGQPVILKSVLDEILYRAIKRTGAGSIYISVKTLEKSAGKFLLRFEVGDSGTGSGLSESNLLHFQELLASVGGQISEHSNKGAGQTVWFTMMLQKQHKQHKQNAAA